MPSCYLGQVGRRRVTNLPITCNDGQDRLSPLALGYKCNSDLDGQTRRQKEASSPDPFR